MPYQEERGLPCTVDSRFALLNTLAHNLTPRVCTGPRKPHASMFMVLLLETSFAAAHCWLPAKNSMVLGER
jgi:hypothetical protein